MYFIAVLLGISVQLTLFLFYLYHSYRYRGITSEKLQYYITANVPLATTAVYGLALVKYNDLTADPGFLNFFFIEWMITTPLLLINIGRVLHIKLYKYFFLLTAAILMNFLGYLSYNIEKTIAFAPFAAGSLCYSFIVIFLAILYRRRKQKISIDPTSEQSITLHVAGRLLFILFSFWTLYPVVLLSYMFGILTTDITITLFVALDFFSKGAFTLLLLGYYDSLSQNNTLLHYLARPRSIVPMLQPQPQQILISPSRILIEAV
jgi:bacteriorhodopsin